MSGHHPPLDCNQVITILKNLGFEFHSQKSTSHQKWRKKGHAGSVTIDCPKAPFSHDLIRYMAKQAGVTTNDFYAALKKS